MSLYNELSKERKAAQEAGTLPEWYTTPSYQILKERYLDKDETYRDRVRAIAERAASHMKGDAIVPNSAWASIFFDLIWSGKLSPSTPVLSSMGRDDHRAFPVSCSGNSISDSIEGFYSGITENAILSKHGFGTSSYMGNIRHRGANIRDSKIKASGTLPVFKAMVQMTRDVNQGGIRRGQWAGYLDIQHNDFDEIVNHYLKQPDDFNVGWVITDKFVQALQDKDLEALRRFQTVLHAKMVTGKGYFFFKDKVNRANPIWYKDKGVTVEASNLCVVPETRVLTDRGYFSIIELADQEVNIWNGKEFSKSLVRQTGSNQKILKVITSHGQELEATEYHKWCRVVDYKGNTERVSTIELRPGDKLVKFELPIIEGNLTLRDAYQNGFFSGDGCTYKGTNIVYFYGEKRKLTSLFSDIKGNWCTQNDQDRDVLFTKELKDKFFVPLDNYTIESRLLWLAGICDSDGTVAKVGDNESIQIGSINKSFLLEIQELLQTLGIYTRLNVMREAGYHMLPANDGSGLNKEYYTQKVYRLLISSGGLYKLLTLGFKPNRLKVKLRLPQRDATSFNTVVEVRDEGRFSDTYCFNEPKRHMGVFNGILTFNCSEIALPSSQEETFTCVLSSLNLSLWDEITDSDISKSLVFLHCVALEFIRLGENIEGMQKAIRFTKRHKALGLGALGFHTYLQSKGIPFESLDAHFKNLEIFKRISDIAESTTRNLAKVFGDCDAALGYGVANTHLTAIAPNLSSALLCGGVSQGIEPIYKNAFIQNTSAGKIIRVNPVLLKIMQERLQNVDEEVDNIITKYNGSVQFVDWLSEEEKVVFRTAFEINQNAIIRLAAARQPYITQAQSINLFFTPDTSEEEIAQVHKEAFLNENIKSLYYIRSETGLTKFKPDKECIACEG